MSEFPRYDRYPAAILADTQHLTLAEHGAYNRLLDTMWLQGARLPNDTKRLGRIVGASGRNWQRIWPNLQELFLVSEDGRWITQKRMTEEFEKARGRAEKAEGNANKRWTHRDGKMPTHRDGKMPTQTAHNPLTNNNQVDARGHATRARAQSAVSNKDKSEALSKGASSYPLASDLPSGAASARDILAEAEAEMIEQYRRAKHIRERLKAAGFIGLRIIPP